MAVMATKQISFIKNYNAGLFSLIFWPFPSPACFAIHMNKAPLLDACGERSKGD
jgi:hypothetical protein